MTNTLSRKCTHYKQLIYENKNKFYTQNLIKNNILIIMIYGKNVLCQRK